MAVLVGAHVPELLCRCRMSGLQALRIIIIDAGVFFFERDGQGQDLTLAQALEGSQGHELSSAGFCFVTCIVQTAGSGSYPPRRGTRSEKTRKRRSIAPARPNWVNRLREERSPLL